MMLQLGGGFCFPRVLVDVYVGLAFVDAFLAVLAFSQLARIHSRTSQIGWTRQKVFHSMIGSSNTGCFLYFVLALVASCKGWPCWLGACGFIFIAFPKILFLAVFLLLLSFWVDLCHQPDDDEDEEEVSSYHETLLEKPLQNTDSYRRWFPLRSGHVGSRQKAAVLVLVLLLVITMAFALVIWIGMGENPIDPMVAAQVYVDLFSIVILLTGGALGCYGLLLCLKMRKVRSERASTEISKVAGLAIVSLLCFSSSSFVALFTNIPLLYWWQPQHMNDVNNSLLLFLYYFIGSAVPSALVLWITRELPSSISTYPREESSTITFISSVAVHPNWISSTSLQNQIARVSPSPSPSGRHFMADHSLSI